MQLGFGDFGYLVETNNRVPGAPRIRARNMEVQASDPSSCVCGGRFCKVITYSAVISACEKRGRWEEAMLVLADMQRLGMHALDADAVAQIPLLQVAALWQ